MVLAAGGRARAAVDPADTQVITALEELAAKIERLASAPRGERKAALKEILEPPYDGGDPLEQEIRAMVRVRKRWRGPRRRLADYSPAFASMAHREGILRRPALVEQVPEIIVTRPSQRYPTFFAATVQWAMKGIEKHHREAISEFLQSYGRQLNRRQPQKWRTAQRNR